MTYQRKEMRPDYDKLKILFSYHLDNSESRLNWHPIYCDLSISPGLTHKPFIIFSFHCPVEEGEGQSGFGGHVVSSQDQPPADFLSEVLKKTLTKVDLIFFS